MSSTGKAAKETATARSESEQSTTGTGRKRQASFAVGEEPAAKMARDFHFANKTKEEIETTLRELYNRKDSKGLEEAGKQLKELHRLVFSKENKTISADEIFDLNGEASSKLTALSFQQVPINSSKLGANIRSLGLGSSAGNSENKGKVDAVLTSYESNDSDRKGAMLSHFFYRRFLCHIYGTPNEERRNRLKLAKQQFLASLELIWKKTSVGIVRYKNSTGSTPEPPATSLLAADINQLVSKIVGAGETTEDELNEEDEKQIQHPFIKWASEYTLYHTEDTHDTGDTSNETKKPSVKCPRTDGLLVAADPNKDNVLRALVSMEAKLDSFDKKANYQNRSNAIDAYSQQEPNSDTPWPLLLFRYTLRHNANHSVTVLALVPTTPEKSKAVMLWESSEEDAIYQSIVAAVWATNDFIREVRKKGRTLDHCKVHGNVVLDEEEGVAMVYKCFFNTERRHPNLYLIQSFVDKDAEEVSLGRKGCYLKMKWVGSVLTNDDTCCMLAFLQIARELRRLHEEGYCHGDIRVSNLILDGENGAKLVDFDLAGETGVTKYPYTLLNLVDGARHEDIQKAIESKKVGDMKLEEKHDWFSLVEAMKCFEVKNEKDEGTWNSLIKQVEQGISGDTFLAKYNFNEEDLQKKVLRLKKSVKEKAKVKEATGSPNGK